MILISICIGLILGVVGMESGSTFAKDRKWGSIAQFFMGMLFVCGLLSMYTVVYLLVVVGVR